MKRKKQFSSCPHFMTSPEAAELLRIGYYQFLRLVKARRIGAYKAGRSYLFDYERHIVPYLRENETIAGAPAHD